MYSEFLRFPVDPLVGRRPTLDVSRRPRCVGVQMVCHSRILTPPRFRVVVQAPTWLHVASARLTGHRKALAPSALDTFRAASDGQAIAPSAARLGISMRRRRLGYSSGSREASLSQSGIPGAGAASSAVAGGVSGQRALIAIIARALTSAAASRKRSSPASSPKPTGLRARAKSPIRNGTEDERAS
jgi:hypothetical protein